MAENIKLTASIEVEELKGLKEVVKQVAEVQDLINDMKDAAGGMDFGESQFAALKAHIDDIRQTIQKLKDDIKEAAKAAEKDGTGDAQQLKRVDDTLEERLSQLEAVFKKFKDIDFDDDGQPLDGDAQKAIEELEKEMGTLKGNVDSLVSSQDQLSTKLDENAKATENLRSEFSKYAEARRAETDIQRPGGDTSAAEEISSEVSKVAASETKQAAEISKEASRAQKESAEAMEQTAKAEKNGATSGSKEYREYAKKRGEVDIPRPGATGSSEELKEVAKTSESVTKANNEQAQAASKASDDLEKLSEDTKAVSDVSNKTDKVNNTMADYSKERQEATEITRPGDTSSMEEVSEVSEEVKEVGEKVSKVEDETKSAADDYKEYAKNRNQAVEIERPSESTTKDVEKAEQANSQAKTSSKSAKKSAEVVQYSVEEIGKHLQSAVSLFAAVDREEFPAAVDATAGGGRKRGASMSAFLTEKSLESQQLDPDSEEFRILTSAMMEGKDAFNRNTEEQEKNANEIAAIKAALKRNAESTDKLDQTIEASSTMSTQVDRRPQGARGVDQSIERVSLSLNDVADTADRFGNNFEKALTEALPSLDDADVQKSRMKEFEQQRKAINSYESRNLTESNTRFGVPSEPKPEQTVFEVSGRFITSEEIAAVGEEGLRDLGEKRWQAAQTAAEQGPSVDQIGIEQLIKSAVQSGTLIDEEQVKPRDEMKQIDRANFTIERMAQSPENAPLQQAELDSLNVSTEAALNLSNARWLEAWNKVSSDFEKGVGKFNPDDFENEKARQNAARDKKQEIEARVLNEIKIKHKISSEGIDSLGEEDHVRLQSMVADLVEQQVSGMRGQLDEDGVDRINKVLGKFAKEGAKASGKLQLEGEPLQGAEAPPNMPPDEIEETSRALRLQTKSEEELIQMLEERESAQSRLIKQQKLLDSAVEYRIGEQYSLTEGGGPGGGSGGSGGGPGGPGGSSGGDPEEPGREHARMLERANQWLYIIQENNALQQKIDKTAGDLSREAGDAMARYGDKITEAMQTGDINSMEAFGEIFSRVGQNMSRTSKDILKQNRNLMVEANEIDQFIEEQRGRQDKLIADAKKSEAEMGGGLMDTERREQALAIEREVRALEHRKEAIGETINDNEKMHQSLLKEKSELNEVVVAHRVYRDAHKVHRQQLQKGIRDYFKVQLAMENVGGAVSDVIGRMQEGGGLDLSGAQRVNDVYRDLENNIRNAENAIQELETREAAMIKQTTDQFEAGKGEFRVETDEFDEPIDMSQAIKAEEAYNARIQAIQDEKIQKQETLRSQIKDLTRDRDKLHSSGAVQAAEDAQSLEQISKNMEDMGRKGTRIMGKFTGAIEKSTTSTADFASKAQTIKKARSEYRTLTNTIEDMELSLSQLELTSGGEAQARKMIDRLKAMRQDMAQTMSGPAAGQADAVLFTDSMINKNEKQFQKLGGQLQQFQWRWDQGHEELSKGGIRSLAAAQDLKKLGTELKSARQNATNVIATYDQLERQTGSLTQAQREKREEARKLTQRFTEMGTSLHRMRPELNRVEKSATAAGNRFKEYNHDLANSIVNNFRFIHAMGLITSAMLGVRQGFQELIEESKIMARVMTVARSNFMDFEETSKTVKNSIRELTIEFGETIDQVGEVVKQFGSAGLEIEESLAGAKPALELITSTGAEAESTTRSMAGIFNVFGDQLSDTGNEMEAFAKIGDVMSSVYRNHQVELDELTQGLRFASSTGKVAGFTFQDLSAYLAVLNDNMVKSGQAGRTLQRVFAQFAAKTEDFTAAFGVELDPDAQLSEQFLGVLQHVNTELRTGATTIDDLENTFSMFGLRGARAFEVLAGNVEDVEDALSEMNDESAGVNARLSDMTKDSLHRHWESMKQSLLEFVRSGLDPAVAALKILTNEVGHLQEMLEIFYLDKFISNAVVWGGSLLLVIQSFTAMRKVLKLVVGATLTYLDQKAAAIAESYEKAKATMAEARAQEHLNKTMAAAPAAGAAGAAGSAGKGAATGVATAGAAAGAGAGAAGAGAAAAGKAGSVGLLGMVKIAAKGLLALLGGWAGAVVVTLMGLYAAWRFFSRTTRDITKEIDENRKEMAENAEESRDLNDLKEGFQELNEDVQTASVSVENFEGRLRELARNSDLVMSDLGVGGLRSQLMTDSPEDLMKGFNSITEDIEIATARRQAAIDEMDREIADEQVQNNLDNFFKEYDSSNTVEAFGLEKWNSSLIVATERLALLIGGLQETGDLEPIDMAELLDSGEISELESESIDDLSELIKDIDPEARENMSEEAYQDMINEFLSGSFDWLDETIEQYEGLGKNVDELIRAQEDLYDRIRRGVENSQFADLGPVMGQHFDPRDTLGGMNDQFFNIAEMPLNIDRFEELDEEIGDVTESTDQAVDRLTNLQHILEGDVTALDSNTIFDSENGVSVAMDPRAISEELQSAIKLGGDDAIAQSAGFFHDQMPELFSFDNMAPLLESNDIDPNQFIGDASTEDWVEVFKEAENNSQLDRAIGNFGNQMAAKVVEGSQDVSIVGSILGDAIREGEGLEEFSDNEFFGNLVDDTGAAAVNLGLLNDQLRTFSVAVNSENADGRLSRMMSNIVSRVNIAKMNNVRDNIIESYSEGMRAAAIAANEQNEMFQDELELSTMVQRVTIMDQQGDTIDNIVEELTDKQESIADLELQASRDETEEEELEKLNEEYVELMDTLWERQQLESDIAATRREMYTNIVASNNAMKEQNIQLGIARRNLSGNVSLVAEQFKEMEQQQKARLDEMYLTRQIVSIEEDLEGLTRDRVDLLDSANNLQETSINNAVRSREAHAEIVEMYKDMVELRNELADEMREEEGIIIDNLKAAEEILHSDNEMAGVRYELVGLARQMNHLEKNRQRLLQRRDITETQMRSEMVQHHKEVLSVYDSLSSVIDEMMDQEDDLNEVYDRRIDILESISDSYDQQKEEAREAFEEVADVRVDAFGDSFAREMSKVIGVDAVTVMQDTDRAIDQMVDSAGSGEANLSELSGGLRLLAESAAGAEESQRAVNEQLDELRRIQSNRARASFRTAVDTGNVDRATEQFENLSTLVESRFGDSPRALRAASQELMDMSETLAEMESEAANYVMGIEVDEDDRQALFDLFEEIKDEIAGIQEMSLEMLGLTEDDLEGSNIIEFFTRNFGGEGQEFLWDVASGDKSVDLLESIDGHLEGLARHYDIPVDEAAKKVADKFGGSDSGSEDEADDVNKAGDALAAATGAAGDAASAANDAAEQASSVDTEAATDLARNLDEYESFQRSFISDIARLGSQMGERPQFMADEGSDVRDSNQVVDTIASAFQEGVENVGGLLSSFVSESFIPNFAQENAEVYRNYLDQLSDVRKSYNDNIDTAVNGLRRNESGYNSYVNSVIDAEKTRRDELLAAQEEYRDSIKSTREVIEEQFGKAFESLFDSENVSNITNALTTMLTGDSGMDFSMDRMIGTFDILRADIIDSFSGVGETISGAVPTDEIGFTIKRTFDNLRPEIKNQLLSSLPEIESFDVDEIMGEVDDEELANRLNSFADNFTAMPQEDIDQMVAESFPDSAFIKSEVEAQFLDAAKSVSSVFKSAMVTAASGLTKMIMGGIGEVVQMTLAEDSVDMMRQYRKFIRELPVAISEFAREFTTNFDIMASELGTHLPEAVELLVGALPDIISNLINSLRSSLPRIVAALAEGLPVLIRQVVPILVDLIILVVEQIPTLMGALAESSGALVEGILENMGELIVVIGMAVIQSVAEVVRGLFTSGEHGGLSGMIALLVGLYIAWRQVVNSSMGANAQQAAAAQALQASAQNLNNSALNLSHAAAALGGAASAEAGSNISSNVENVSSAAQSNAGAISQNSNSIMQTASGVMAVATAVLSLVNVLADEDASKGKKWGAVIGTVLGGLGGALAGSIIPGLGTAAGLGAGSMLGGQLGAGIGAKFSEPADELDDLPTYHTGGVINDVGEAIKSSRSKGEVPIMALEGEGVLSHRGLSALGGPLVLEALNKGQQIGTIVDEVARDNGTYHSGGVIGGSQSSIDPSAVRPSRSSGGGGDTNVTTNIEVKAGDIDSERDRRKLADRIAKDVDKSLAKMHKDRKSEYSKTIDK